MQSLKRQCCRLNSIQQMSKSHAYTTPDRYDRLYGCRFRCDTPPSWPNSISQPSELYVYNSMDIVIAASHIPNALHNTYANDPPAAQLSAATMPFAEMQLKVMTLTNHNHRGSPSIITFILIAPMNPNDRPTTVY